MNNNNRKTKRKTSVSLIVLVAFCALLFLAPSALTTGRSDFLPVWSSASSPPVVNCLPSNVTAPLTLTNVQCTEFTSVFVTGNGAITLVGSTLVENGGANFGQIALSGTTKLVLINSSIVNSTITLANQSSFFSSSGSVLDLANFRSSGLTTIQIQSTTLIDDAGSVNLAASALEIQGSTLSLVTSQAPLFSAGNLSIEGSQIDSSGSRANMTFIGSSSLSIINSTLSKTLNSTLPSTSAIYLSGGVVRVLSSKIVSSGVTSFGYPPSTDSILSVNGGENVSIVSSNLVAGETLAPGSYKSSTLTIYSGSGNATLTDSTLQSVSLSASVSVSSNSGSLGSVLLRNSLIELQNSTGSVQLAASRYVQLENSRLGGPRSTLKVLSQSMIASDSVLIDSNITRDLTFGAGLETGTFYNTTLSQCATTSSQSCLTVVQQGGSYTAYGFLFAHVSDSKSSAVPNATVTAVDTKTGFTQYAGITNATGWAEIQVLLTQATFSTAVSEPYYVIEASSQGDISPQKLVASNSTFYAALVVDAPISNIGNANLANQPESSIAAQYDLSQYSYAFNPPTLYKLGQYLGTQYIPYLTVLSNAVPLNFRNNATSSEVDFSTVGQKGGTFYFVVIYPKNLTTSSLSLRVDGAFQNSVETQSNSTHYLSIFSVPSGAHDIALVFTLANGYYKIPVKYPSLYPSVFTIGAIMLLAVVGIVFVVVYVRRNERSVAEG